VNPVHKKTKLFSAGMLAGLAFCLWTGCASSSSQNRKVYDRYAALVAERNRTMGAPAVSSSPAQTPASLPAAAPVPVKSPPVQVIAPKPVEKAEPKLLPPPAPPVLPQPVSQALSPIQREPVAPAPAGLPPPPAQMPASKPATPSAYVASPSADGVAYLLKVGDVVQVSLRGIPSADSIEDVIDEDGMISLPLINEIQAAGMTASELERNIRKTYLDQDIYRNIAVNVVVPTRYYFIQGEIRAPGRFQIVSATRLSQAIAAAGGYTEYASGQVLVKRGGKIVKTIRNSRRLERTPEDDILLEPDDIIEVKRSLW
jgi:protein involved in polysaccharide export with SLBB domain